jgi:hypothetical protein
MADRFPGGVISKTPPTVVAPVDGEGGSASGVWTLDEQLGLEKAGNWPKPVLPRELVCLGRQRARTTWRRHCRCKVQPCSSWVSYNWAQVSAGQGYSPALQQTELCGLGAAEVRGKLGTGNTANQI